MYPSLPRPLGLARFRAATAVSAVLLLALCGCQTDGMSDITGSLGAKAEKTSPAQSLESYRDRYRSHPEDANAALNYGKALRASGQRSQAVAMLEQATIAHPGDKALMAGYGRALADNGNFQQALEVLGRAHSPEDPDWRILSAQGAVLDQLGRGEEARQYYASALRIVPDEPSVLSNLALSYVLSKDLAKAEETLRRANAHGDAGPRVKLNLALVVGLRGNMAEAESLAKEGRPPEEAAANVAYLKRMLAKQAAAKPAPGGAARTD
ncbi:tetratricopeptide repeat protein [Bradyrhizobium erythrophlei]|jgi:Flp pilus assembly protein TadD|uniref:Flp pilus assembly protein TadD, contains TPR repeats n=1 Tax=Bradyrhizobium erythrophlei TaxID=1437360 RepID=A0A1M7TUZ8_9BRAD|nr:tetratricopeptide repeat protein [Bradyrhizobium erythrophlei]SHN74541.1 Flp pilus assembly protein TadD, contains TPR repeats [Bradyrhizobium erythrophlei]